MNLFIRRSTGVKFHVTVDGDAATVLSLKESIAAAESDLPVETQRLIYKGRILDNDPMLLSFYGISHDSTLHLVKGSASRASVSSAAVSSTAVSSAANTTAVSSSSTTPNTTLNGNSTPPPPSSLLLPTTTTTTDPEQLAELMNSPMMQAVMTPDVLRNMMDSNPQMRELMRQNPQLREVLNDPDLMRQSLQMMRDPNAMRNAMRNQELAMSQIENMPGRF